MKPLSDKSLIALPLVIKDLQSYTSLPDQHSLLSIIENRLFPDIKISKICFNKPLTNEIVKDYMPIVNWLLDKNFISINRTTAIYSVDVHNILNELDLKNLDIIIILENREYSY